MAQIRTQLMGQTPDFVAGAVTLMCEQLGAQLTVADLADHVGYSRYHFSRMFAQVTGLAPMEYLAALRFAEAKRLLLTSDEPVVDVCAQVGFTSLSTFSRRFRLAVGTAPAGLRRLADEVAEHPVAPFEVNDPSQPRVVVRLDLGAGVLTLGMPRQTWIGWYPRPVPIGLPAAGALVSGIDRVEMPLCAGNPWLLAVSMPSDADPLEQLAPAIPLVAGHPAPVTPASLMAGEPLASSSVVAGISPEIVLAFAPAAPHTVPLLSALASLRVR